MIFSWSDQKFPVIKLYHINRRKNNPVVHHVIIDLAPTSNDEDSSYILGEFNLETIKHITMQAPARNLRIQQLSYRGAAAVALPLALKLTCWVQLFDFWPCPSAQSQLNRIDLILFAMAPYRVLFQLLALVQWRARAHYACYCLYTAIWHCQWEIRQPDRDSDSESARLTPPKGGL